jgi:hypothetical protein
MADENAVHTILLLSVLWNNVHLCFFYIKICASRAWWHIPIIQAFRRLRQEDPEPDVSLGYILRPCLKKKKNYSILYWNI